MRNILSGDLSNVRSDHDIYRDAIDEAVKYKENPTDIDDQILEELDNFDYKPSSNKDE